MTLILLPYCLFIWSLIKSYIANTKPRKANRLCLWSTCYCTPRGWGKRGVGGTPTGLLQLVSQRCRKWNIFQRAICLWQRTCNRVSSENHFRGTGWKAALTSQEQRSASLLLLQLVSRNLRGNVLRVWASLYLTSHIFFAFEIYNTLDFLKPGF